MSDWEIRPREPGDDPFIFSAWLRGLGGCDPSAQVCNSQTWIRDWHRAIEWLLADDQAIVLLAHLRGEPGQLLGFAAGRGRLTPQLHWCYVKQPYRGLGIARALIAALGADRIAPFGCSLWSPHLCNKPGWEYDPSIFAEYHYP